MKTVKIIKMVAIILALMVMMTGCADLSGIRDQVEDIIYSGDYSIENMSMENSDAWSTIDTAVTQYQNQDHTPSEKAVVHKMLWLGYTKVSYENLDMRMDYDGVELLKGVANSFKHVVENLAEYNVDIQIDLYFIDEERTLTFCDGEGFIYLDNATVEDDIQIYNADGEYDSVMTVVQSGGEENYNRNCEEDIYFENPVILGLNTKSIDETYGYSTFDLGDPCGQIFFDDPSIPSCIATAVAVHEWMHQFEEIGYTLGVEFPCTHAYMGGEEFVGYETYEENGNGYFDYFEFYSQVLSGTVPYIDGNGDVHYVGMYPEMWKLTTTAFWVTYSDSIYI